jgi:hypothetical protein
VRLGDEAKGTDEMSATNRNGTWELAKDATLRLPRGRNGVVVRAERGEVVVTQAGDPDDHVVACGEALWLPRGGLAVAWALSPARLVVEDAEPHAVAASAGARPALAAA